MQKLFQSCYAMDQKCYTAYGLNEDILMEHAAQGMATYIQQHVSKGSRILIVAGVGNNGADGMVLARQLAGIYDVKLYVPFGVKSLMAQQQFERTQKVGVCMVDTLEEADVIVDALFGAGLNRELDTSTQKLVEQMNLMEGLKIACDVPTGVGVDGRLMPLAFRADVTITMGALKEGLYLDEAKEVIGEVVCVDLGVSRSNYEDESNTFVLEASDLQLPSRKSKVTHKGTFGHAAVFCGEKEGAGIIAATAASRFGAGLTTLIVHERVSPPPFLMHSTVVPKGVSALAIGMGLGGHFDTPFLQTNVVDSPLPIVLDADAFYNRLLLEVLHQKERQVVLTPHPKEFVALWREVSGEVVRVDEVQQYRFEMVRRFNEQFAHVTLLLKGANMLMAHQNRLYVNPLGGSNLSKGGSGDVLSGLIVALLAQGYSGIDAAIYGSLALTQAAALYRGATYAMLPTDIIDGVAMLENMV